MMCFSILFSLAFNDSHKKTRLEIFSVLGKSTGLVFKTTKAVLTAHIRNDFLLQQYV